MQERFKFVLEAHKREQSIAQLCRELGISRTSGHKWLRRYDQSRLPSPSTTSRGGRSTARFAPTSASRTSSSLHTAPPAAYAPV